MCQVLRLKSSGINNTELNFFTIWNFQFSFARQHSQSLISKLYPLPLFLSESIRYKTTNISLYATRNIYVIQHLRFIYTAQVLTPYLWRHPATSRAGQYLHTVLFSKHRTMIVSLLDLNYQILKGCLFFEPFDCFSTILSAWAMRRKLKMAVRMYGST